MLTTARRMIVDHPAKLTLAVAVLAFLVSPFAAIALLHVAPFVALASACRS